VKPEVQMEYRDICFVIMPFGKKELVGAARSVNFDLIYNDIFAPAIGDAILPEGGHLEPHRTDKDFFSGDIGQEMFDYLEYSRVVLTDITGLNPNVFYELGVRHRARQSGTLIFRQVDAKIPFDIAQIKAFPYEYEPEEQARESKRVVTRVLKESLQENRIDSPVQRALLVQRQERSFIESDLRDAENAIRVQDWNKAISAYRKALAADCKNNLLHLRLGLLLKDHRTWQEALQQFNEAIAAAPTYAEAYREKGIAENKIYHSAKNREGLSDGIDALSEAIRLNPGDYDALASLGGVLRRAGRIPDALEKYERAVEASHGHSYPLLNALKLRAQLTHELRIDSKLRFQLDRAERSLRAQVASQPPYDAPWSFFDLAEICLYRGDRDEFLSFAAKGADHAARKSQVEAFQQTLHSLLAAGVNIAGLEEGLDVLAQKANLLSS
jgi:tetratricopeptide (TPR) repeat protein